MANKSQAGRLPPQSIEAEQAVLGCMLINNEAVSKVIQELNSTSFYKSSNATIFDSMVDGVRKLADTIPALNFMDDPKLNDIAYEIRLELSPNAILLRDSEYEREVVSTKADDILRKLGTLYAT